MQRKKARRQEGFPERADLFSEEGTQTKVVVRSQQRVPTCSGRGFKRGGLGHENKDSCQEPRGESAGKGHKIEVKTSRTRSKKTRPTKKKKVPKGREEHPLIKPLRG